MSNQKKLGEILIEKQIITTAQLEEALKRQKGLSLRLGDTLLHLKFVSENLLLETLSEYLGIEFLNIAENDYQMIDKSLSRMLPLDVCQKYKVLPLFQIVDEDTKELSLAMADPFLEEAIKDVEAITEFHVTPVLATSAAILGGLGKLYAIKTDFKIERYILEKEDTVSLVNKILEKAVSYGASDIHVEPHRNEVHVRMRIDGVLEVASTYPSAYHTAAVSRIKIMASENSSSMKIDEKRLPQDGAFSTKIVGHTVDCRVSTMPTLFGEKVVMRLFDKDTDVYIGRIKDLKLSPRMEVQFRRCVRRPSGINIVTGPTGSGKTTTLNAIINEINSADLNIITIEDPVEHQAPDYVNQSSLMPQAGYTYTRALRAMMRQDPDIILIGEVRDLETAEIAVQAALTGHRVFTTLHTENAAGSIMRLIDIGVEHFLVSAVLSSAINQRLVRKICNRCSEEYIPTKIELMDIGIDKEIADEILKDPHQFNLRRGRGCEHCRKTGYHGRQPVFELITVTQEIRDLIYRKQGSADTIALTARDRHGINLIFEEGLRLFLTGVTTLGELQNLPKGDYKVKSPKQILLDSAMH
ncbi:MAG: GspE/PulE family protein [Syntrophales bacterium]|jgi:type IV pilus assembly protein PilB|nr:GspE/PulE family protein [Syntrophales bacterium]